MNFLDLPIQFQVEVDNVSVSAELREEAKRRLLDLAEAHRDLTGASISITAPVQNTDVPFLFQVRVVVYIRPNDIIAVKQDDTVQGALVKALDAVERQVRENRKKRKESWKRHDIPGTLADYREEEAILLGEVSDEQLVDELKEEAEAVEKTLEEEEDFKNQEGRDVDER
jgi:ribosome-associated translation inhibitor RaiA